MALSSAAKVGTSSSWSHQLTSKRLECSKCSSFSRNVVSNRLGSHRSLRKELGVTLRVSERRTRTNIVCASGEGNESDTAVKEKQEENVVPDKAKPTEEDVQLTLSDINPVSLGRRSREFFNDVWKRLTDLGQLTRSSPSDVDTVLVSFR